MSYTLHYAITLAVPGLIDEGGADLSPARVASALRAMANEIEARPETIGMIRGRGPVFAEAEDRWVLRSATLPKVVFAPDGRVNDPVPVRTCGVEDAITLTSGEIASRNVDPGPERVWVRPEDVGGVPVLAKMRGPDGALLGQADLRQWLSEQDNATLTDIADSGWDLVAHMEVAGDNPHDPLHADPNFIRLDRQRVRYATSVEAEDVPAAIDFLRELRPELADRLEGSHSPDGP